MKLNRLETPVEYRVLITVFATIATVVLYVRPGEEGRALLWAVEK